MPRVFAFALVFLFDLAASAATLTVKVNRQGFTGPIDVALAMRVEGRPPEWSATKTLASKQSSVRFDDVRKGLYTVLASGAQPLQRVSAKANVGASDATVSLVIPKKSKTVLRATLASAPIPRATIALTHDELRWRTEVTTDDDGQFAGDLWEPSVYTASVSRDATSAPHRADVYVMSPLTTIEVPDRIIRGNVVDVDGAPIAGAMVTLRSEASQSTLSMRTRTAPDGSFEFFGVREGNQTLAARAASFLDSDAARFELRGASAQKSVELTLTHGAPRTVRVIDARDRAIADALLLTSCNGDVKSTATTDAEGIAEVALPTSDTCAIYALPKEGSIAVGRITASDRMTIRVPDGSSSLNMILETEAGDVFSDLQLLMRIDGMTVPPEIARLLAPRGLSLATNADGAIALNHIPPGTYEFWPYRTPSEGQMLFETASDFAAPILVKVLTGENNATIRFAAR